MRLSNWHDRSLYLIECPRCTAWKLGYSVEPWRRFPELVRGRAAGHYHPSKGACRGQQPRFQDWDVDGVRLSLRGLYEPDRTAQDLEKAILDYYHAFRLPNLPAPRRRGRTVDPSNVLVRRWEASEWMVIPERYRDPLIDLFENAPESKTWWTVGLTLAPFSVMTPHQRRQYRKHCPDKYAPSKQLRDYGHYDGDFDPDEPAWKNPP